MYEVKGVAGEGNGRYVVSREDIPAGQVIIKEKPIFLGLKQGNCVSCFVKVADCVCSRFVNKLIRKLTNWYL